MRAPRVRITIGRMLVLVPLAGLASWGFVDVVLLRLGRPTPAETQADAAHRQAKFVREVAEYAVKDYLSGSMLAGAGGPGPCGIGPIRLGPVELARRATDLRELERDCALVGQARDQFAGAEAGSNTLKSLLADIETAKAQELVKLEALRLERIRRGRALLGF